jgi:hypothetical protein
VSVSQSRGDGGGVASSRHVLLQNSPSLPLYDALVQKLRTQTAMGCNSRQVNEQNSPAMPFQVYSMHPGRLQIGSGGEGNNAERQVKEQNSPALPFHEVRSHPVRMQLAGGGDDERRAMRLICCSLARMLSIALQESA